MKKLLIKIAVFSLIPLCILGYLFFPVKYALKQKDLDALEEPYILIKWEQVTDFSWVIVGDQNGYYDRAKYIFIRGNMPDIVQNYGVAIGHNTYVCYGYYAGEREDSNGKLFPVYHCTGWDILYPVKRQNIIPFLPGSYLCKADILGL